jgi:WD40 repeat protein
LRRDHYKTLGVKPDADASEIKKAYRKMARKFHPDVNSSSDAAQRMVEVNEAYRTLSSVELRSEYDSRLRRGVADAPSPKARAAGEVLVTHHLSVVDLPSPVYAAAFSSDGKQLAVACFDNTIRCIDPRSGADMWEVQLSGGVVSEIRWVPGGRLVAAGASDKSVSSWLISNREVSESRVRRIEWVSQIAISPSGRWLALGGVDSAFAVIDRRTGRERFSSRWHEASVVAVAFSTNGKLIASGGNDQRILLMEAESGVPICRFDAVGAEPTKLAFSPDDSLLAAALVDRSVRVYEIRSGLARKAFWGHDASIEALTFHPNGWLLASSDRRGETRIWNAMGGKAVSVLGGHRTPVKCAAFSKDGRMLATAGLDRSISLWSIDVGEARSEEKVS